MQLLLQHSIENEQPPPVGEQLDPPLEDPPLEDPPLEDPPLDEPPLDEPPLDEPPLEEDVVLPSFEVVEPSSSSPPHARTSEAERSAKRTVFGAFMPRRRRPQGLVAKKDRKKGGAGAPAVFASGQGTFTRFLRSAGGNVYWTSTYPSNGVFRGAPKTATSDGGLDGSVTALDGPFPYLLAMTTNATHAYYGYGGGGSTPEYIGSYTLATGAKNKLFETTTTGYGWRGFALDGSHLYMTTRFNGFTRISLSTGVAERFARVDESANGIAADSTSIYATFYETGRVRRVRKPAN